MAGVKISALPAAVANAVGDLIAIVQSGVTRQISLSSIADWIVKTSLSFVQSGTGAVAEPVQTTLRRVFYAEQFTGYDSTGTTDSYTAVVNALAAAAGYPLVIRGTPLIGTTINWTTAGEIIFDGAPGVNNGTARPKSYFKKASTLSGDCITLNGGGLPQKIVGGGVVGVAGNSGDNIGVQNYNFRLFEVYSELAGNDGFRFGVTANNTNTDFGFALACKAKLNVRDGLHIESNTSGSAEANSIQISQFISDNNGRDGIRAAHCLNLHIFGGGASGNTGYGLNIDVADGTSLFGGDWENNTAGQINCTANHTSTTFYNVNPAFTLTNAGPAVTQLGAYKTVINPTTAGTMDNITVGATTAKPGTFTDAVASNGVTAKGSITGGTSIGVHMDYGAIAASTGRLVAYDFNASAYKNLVLDGNTVILNPNGGGGIKWGTALVALGGGAAPTVGTIGGSGPTAAAQNSWMRVLDSTGAAFWVPVWK